MIQLTKLNDKKFFLNCDLIKYIESTPDTVITLTSGEKWMVKEEVDFVVKLIIEYKKRIYVGQLLTEEVQKNLQAQ